MTSTSLRSRKAIPNHIVEVLRLVTTISEDLGIQPFVIGATARDLIFEYVYGANIRRKTEDIDFGIAVGSWSKYDRLKNALIATEKVRPDPNQEQRVWWHDGTTEYRVDLVPYGGLESRPGEIEFPPNGNFVMSTLGFPEASQNVLTLQLTDDFSAQVASLPGLVLLKFVAYNDRPNERRRDIQDIWFIAKNYLSAGNEERLWPGESDEDLLKAPGFDTRTAGARLLGRDIVPLLNEKSQELILKILEEKAEGSIERIADVINREEHVGSDRYQFILDLLRNLKLGITETINE